MEIFGQYKFKIFKKETGWAYQITFDGVTILRESKETFLNEGIARFAAIGHIGLLEKGKG